MPDTASDPNVAENNQQDDRLKDDKVEDQVMSKIMDHLGIQSLFFEKNSVTQGRRWIP